jgi:hypothetical protein
VRTLPPAAAPDDQLRHGYTTSHITALALTAVRRRHWDDTATLGHRAEIAWHAIIEHLYTSHARPGPPDLIGAAFRALSADAARTWQFLGRSPRDHARASGGYERYWQYAARPAASPEDQVIDQLALAQIWPRLRPSHQAVLRALAIHEDYGRAAAALGTTRKTFTTQLGRARHEFLLLWHEGETPSRPWGRDRRGAPGNPNLITTRTIRRRRTTHQHAAAPPPPAEQHPAPALA